MEISRKMVKIFDLSEHTGILWIKTVHFEITTYMDWLDFINYQKKSKSFEVYFQMFIPNFFM